MQRLGSTVLGTTRQVGGVGVLLLQVLRALLPYPSMDGRELWRNLYKMGVRSVPIIILTAFFTGAILVIQSGIFVRRFGATGLLGWGTGYSTFREIGPILIALMFSGRVGANNTAELGTMTVTEQIDGLRALAIDPVRYLIVPRVTSMMIMLFLLTVIGDLVAISGGALFGKLVVGVDFSIFWQSLLANLTEWDLLHGLIKSAAFGLVISLTSCYFGISVRGGAVGVGRAVNAAVVAAAVGILVVDCLLTLSLE
ncbi:MAG: ABC transporter permease [Deltaproteobacteria bacterium]|nr:ABC transporter permease [Deltaproteobacteria bacterium]